MSEEQKEKALGIPLTDNHDNCVGVVISEDGEILGHHVSSSYAWLEQDLKSKENVKEYEFIFCEKPTVLEIFNLMEQFLKKTQQELETEKAKSQKLLEALEFIAGENPSEKDEYEENWYEQTARKAIKKYKEGK